MDNIDQIEDILFRWNNHLKFIRELEEMSVKRERIETWLESLNKHFLTKLKSKL